MLLLFPDPQNEPISIIQKDGNVEYIPNFFSIKSSHQFLAQLSENIPWENDKIQIFGKEIITKRKVAWFGNQPFKYTYSKNTRTALPWSKELLKIKAIIEKKTGEEFNSCLLNLYHDGDEAMGWHTDNEKELKENGTIASVSFGVARKFSFKHRLSSEIVSIQLENGSVLLMKGETQKHWLHRLHPSKKISEMRINLTFRTIAA